MLLLSHYELLAVVPSPPEDDEDEDEDEDEEDAVESLPFGSLHSDVLLDHLPDQLRHQEQVIVQYTVEARSPRLIALSAAALKLPTKLGALPGSSSRERSSIEARSSFNGTRTRAGGGTRLVGLLQRRRTSQRSRWRCPSDGICVPEHLIKRWNLAQAQVLDSSELRWTDPDLFKRAQTNENADPYIRKPRILWEREVRDRTRSEILELPFRLHGKVDHSFFTQAKVENWNPSMDEREDRVFMTDLRMEDSEDNWAQMEIGDDDSGVEPDRRMLLESIQKRLDYLETEKRKLVDDLNGMAVHVDGKHVNIDNYENIDSDVVRNVTMNAAQKKEETIQEFLTAKWGVEPHLPNRIKEIKKALKNRVSISGIYHKTHGLQFAMVMDQICGLAKDEKVPRDKYNSDMSFDKWEQRKSSD
eukprot:g20518.t1